MANPLRLLGIVTWICFIPAYSQGQADVVIDADGNVIPFSNTIDYCNIKEENLTVFSRDDCQLMNPYCNKGHGKGLNKPVCNIVIHNTYLTYPQECNQTDCCNVIQAIHAFYVSIGKCDLPFHYMIDNDGNIYEGRGYNKIGAHVADAFLRCNSYGIAFLEEPISTKAKAAFFILIYCGRQMGCINYNYTMCAHSGNDITATVSEWPGYDCDNFGNEICCKCEDIHTVCGTTRKIAATPSCNEADEVNQPSVGKIMLDGGPGDKATDNQYPFVVSVNGICGGSIIHCQYILTAAHCVENDTWVNVWLGSIVKKGGEKYSAKVIPHGDYKGAGFDIALLKLKKPIKEWTNSIRPICLPSQHGDSYAGRNVTVAGWGFIEPDPEKYPKCLRHTDITVLTDDAAGKCVILAIDQFAAGSCDKTKADYTGITSGDSGGPVFLQEGGKYTLLGVIRGFLFRGTSTATDVLYHMKNWDPLKAIAEEIAACPQP